MTNGDRDLGIPFLDDYEFDDLFTNETEVHSPHPNTPNSVVISQGDTLRSVPGFISKLYRMVEESQTDLIRWSSTGDSFLVSRPEEFAKEVLPRFCKHNNFASFVRQLNMYGFHKIPHIHTAGNGDVWEFCNTNFRRQRPELLFRVKRKMPRQTLSGANIGGGNGAASVYDFNSMASEIQSLKKKQDGIIKDLRELQKTNQHVWNETLATREKYLNQQETITKIVNFLATIFSKGRRKIGEEEKRKRFLQTDESKERIFDEKRDKASDQDIVRSLSELSGANVSLGSIFDGYSPEQFNSELKKLTERTTEFNENFDLFQDTLDLARQNKDISDLMQNQQRMENDETAGQSREMHEAFLSPLRESQIDPDEFMDLLNTE